MNNLEQALSTWPHDGSLAVNIVINFEEGGQRSRALGDESTEPMGEWAVDLRPGERDLYVESIYEFGAAEGALRVSRALAAADAPATVFACGRAYEAHPDLAREFQRRGYDVVGHGYTWTPTLGQSVEAVRADIRRTVGSVRSVTGQDVRGWFSRSPAGVTSRVAAATSGLMYDSMSCADDAPFYVPVLGKSFLIVPYTTDLNDIRFWRGNLFSGDDFADYIAGALAVLLAEARTTPRMMSIGLHPRIIGRPGRIHGLRRVLDLLTQTPWVRPMTRLAIAEAWRDAYPPPTMAPAPDDNGENEHRRPTNIGGEL